MRSFVLATVLAAAAVAAPLTPSSSLAQDAGITVGSVAPSPVVERFDGAPLELATLFAGKPAVLEFWATWCPLCRRLEPSLEAAKTRYAGQVVFVGVGVPQNQSAQRQQAYVQQQKLGGEFVFDRTGAAVAAYKVPHTSYIVIVDAGGKVVHTGVGAEQDIDAVIRKALPDVRANPQR